MTEINYTPRTIDSIFKELLTEKETLTNLASLVKDPTILDQKTLISSLDSSKVAEWVLWLYNVAVAANITEIGISKAVEEIKELIENQIIFTAPFFIKKAKEFQYPDLVRINPDTYQIEYEVISPERQIISSATVTTLPSKLLLKVRRKDTDSLSADEKTALESYLGAIKPVGTQIEVYNFPADEVGLYLEVLYQGNVSLATVKAAVESTINDHLLNLDFDAVLRISGLVDRLQAISGVKDVWFTNGTGVSDTGLPIEFQHTYNSRAGYLRINPATPLSSTIIYTPVSA